MRVFLAGGTGFIGGHLLDGLAAGGHEVTALVRPGARPAPRPGVTWVEGLWLDPDSWRSHLAGHEAVVHAVGIIRATAGATFEAVQAEVPRRLHEAAARAGIRAFVQISALGAVDGAPTPFLRTKRAADASLEASGLRHLILRPSLVYGPGDHSMAFFERLARLPLTPLPDGGGMQVQPVHVADLVRAAMAWLPSGRPGGTFDVGGGEALSFREVLRRLRGRRLRGLPIPAWAMDLAAAATDLLGAGPITRDELRMLRLGSVCDNGPFLRAFGFEPRPFSRGLRSRPSA
ncbi:MAG TPA: NAD(P)H-binding protein [Holophagaceae bacterium]|nr:NAD(P)H-binding protein [Holophagaceae bacterium]